MMSQAHVLSEACLEKLYELRIRWMIRDTMCTLPVLKE